MFPPAIITNTYTLLSEEEKSNNLKHFDKIYEFDNVSKLLQIEQVGGFGRNIRFNRKENIRERYNLGVIIEARHRFLCENY